MTPINTLVALLVELRDLDARLQESFKDLVRRYYSFCRWRNLRLKYESGPGGRKKGARIWKVSWGWRPPRTWGLHERRTRRLPEPFKKSWIFKIACDWARKDTYVAFDRERRALNGIGHQIARVQRNLRLSLVNKWGEHWTSQDCEQAHAIMASSPGLRGEDVIAVASAIVFARHLTGLEMKLDGIVGAYKTIPTSLRPGFDPVLRRRWERSQGNLECGHVRLEWGYPKAYAPGQRRIRSIGVWPTDVLMRKLGLPARTRRAVGAVVRQFRPVHREYGRLIGWLGRYRAEVGQIRTRMQKLVPTPVPEPLRPFHFGSTA